MGFPLLWSKARSRLVAMLVSAAYILSATIGLPQGVATYYGSHGLLGLLFWIGASSAFVVVYGLLWSRRPGWWRPASFGIATLLMAIPPFGIVGWAGPITAAGVLFPGMGWLGLVFCAGLLLLMATSRWPMTLAIAALLGGVSIITWVTPAAPAGWVRIDTRFRGINGQYAGYEQELQTINFVRAALAQGLDNIVLPESALGVWTPTVERLWTDALRGTHATVIAGAVVVTAAGYDNVMIEFTARGGRILYRERMPVPVSMWQPWLAWLGQTGGARADFFANPVVSLTGRRVAMLICYEQLLVWPILQSMLYQPELIVAAGNDWWTGGTNIAGVQRAITEAWGRLFGVPIVFAVNG